MFRHSIIKGFILSILFFPSSIYCWEFEEKETEDSFFSETAEIHLHLKEAKSKNSSPSSKTQEQDEPIAMANLNGEPSSYIHGCVNVITGQYCESEVDLVAPHGVEPIVIQRSYLGNLTQKGSLGRGWTLSHHSKVKTKKFKELIPKKTRKTTDFVLIEDQGGVLPFVKGFQPDVSVLHQLALQKNYTNTSSGYISAQTNLCNLSMKTQSGAPFYFLTLPTGGSKLFRLNKKDYRITNEKKPNGNTLSYYYDEAERLDKYDLENLYLTEIKMENRNRIKTNWITGNTVASSDAHNFKATLGQTLTTLLQFKTWDGHTVLYNIGSINGIPVLKSVVSTQKPEVEYTYISLPKSYGKGGLIDSKLLPHNQLLNISYYDYGENIVHGKTFDLKNPKHPIFYRVKALHLGTKPIYEFIYDLNVDDKHQVMNGKCSVYNALGYLTDYHFNTDQRLTKIDRFDTTNALYTSETLQWVQSSCINRALKEQNRGMIFARTYLYDGRGNLIEDSLYGNLSGKSVFFQSTEEIIQKGECYKKNCRYSDDGFNLLLEEDDGTIRHTYVYEPKSNRLIAKYEWNGPTIYRRWFYSYNADGAPIFEIVDNGSSTEIDHLDNVTERHLTTYACSEITPYAFPVIIEKSCLDLATGQYRSMHKVINQYNQQGKIVRQDHYDRQGILTYSLYWEFDLMGNVLKEVDALGRSTIRKYDLNKNCIYEQGPNPEVHKEMQYDNQNRLICVYEVHSDGKHQITQHRYQGLNDKINTIDPYGNITLFGYDAFGRQICVVSPHILNENHILDQIGTIKTYDPMGHVTSEVDGRGVTTHHTYTLRGKIASTTYPDGTTETNSYALNGHLIESKQRNNQRIRYTNDFLGRPICIETFSSSGELLTTTRATYDAFHLLTETDPAGNISTYSYNPDGQLKSKQKGDHLIEYEYDVLGRETGMREHFGPLPTDLIITRKTFDLLDRVLEEKVLDGNEQTVTHLSYSYDISGNVEQIIAHHETGHAITQTFHDSHGVPYLVIDAEGNKTTTQCRYDYKNELKQNVPYKEITDALGNVTIVIHDVVGRIVKTERKNAFGKLIQKQEVIYDKSGNRIELVDTIISANSSDKKQITRMQYDMCNRLTHCYEAVGTPEQKQLVLTYNSRGQKEKIIKNDGVALNHTYDLLSRLSKMSSSDSSISYSYSYDIYNNPIEIKDLISGKSTFKQYDSENRLTEEKLANGLTMQYRYDFIGRPIQVIFPDQSRMQYSYYANLLQRITRLNAIGEEQYKHEYTQFDQAGRVLKAMTASKQEISIRYDRMGRQIAMETPGWREAIKYDAVGNLVEKTVHDSLGELNCKYNYDDLYQVCGETGAVSHSYTYDSHYNRLSKDGQTHLYNDLNKLLSDGVSTYTYDPNGNLLSKKSANSCVKYKYDALDRLIAIDDGAKQASYSYDDTNRRLSKSVSSDGFTLELLFFYQGQNEIGSCDTKGNVLELRLLGIGKGAEIGAAVAIEIGTAVYVPFHDHAGNIACLIDVETGNSIGSYRYSAYGEELFDECPSPWRFCSKRTDNESGFVYFGRRYYNPQTGRWVTPDPIGREGGPNLYGYVMNNPLTHFDLYGLFDFMEWLGALIGPLLNLVGTLCGVPGCIIQFTAHHLLPIPYVKDLIAFAGHCLSGKNPSKWHKETETVIEKGDIEYSDRKYLMFNGICTTKEQFEDQCFDLSKSLGGAKVYGIYKATDGFMLDISRTMGEKVGVPTEGQAFAQRETSRIAAGLGEGGTLIVQAHSRGAETVHNLSSNLKRMMDVGTYGAARVLNPNEFKRTTNYLSPLDYVTLMADPVGYIAGHCKGYIQYIRPCGSPFTNHNYEGKPYTNARKYHMQMMNYIYGYPGVY